MCGGLFLCNGHEMNAFAKAFVRFYGHRDNRATILEPTMAIHIEKEKLHKLWLRFMEELSEEMWDDVYTTEEYENTTLSPRLICLPVVRLTGLEGPSAPR